MQSEKLIGLPIVHINLGKRCGVVQGLILDPQERCVAGFVVSLPGWRKRGLLSMKHIYATGDQAVTIVDDMAIQAADEESELHSLWQRKLELRGMPVLTVTGRGLGTVEAYDFDLGGAIETVTVHRGGWSRLKRNQHTISGALIRSFGEDAVIVAAEAEYSLGDQKPQAGIVRERTLAEDDASERQSASKVSRWAERLGSWGRRSDSEPDDNEPMANGPQQDTSKSETQREDAPG